MAGYTSGWNSNPGETIFETLFRQEYDALETAFDAAGGHVHDGSAANGAYIPLISTTGNLTEVKCNPATIELSVDVAAAKTLQLTLQDGVLVPALTNDIDLGTPTNRFKDVYAGGAAYVGTLSLSAGVAVTGILDEDDMISDSDTALATQQSIKAFVETNATIDGGSY